MNDPGPEQGTARGAPVVRLEIAAWLALALFVVLSRALAAPDVLAEWDSANYVHGWRHFDVYEHAPHAPGYPLFVLALGALSWLPGPVTTPFLALNIGLSLAVLAMLGWIARVEAGRGVALGVAAGFAVCPAFWYHGAMSTAYVAECFCSMLVGWGAWSLARRRIGVLAAAGVLALAGGLRPAALAYLTPLMLLGLLVSRRRAREWAAFGAATAVGVALWLVPTVALSGGWTRYNTSSKALAYWQASTHSVLGGSWAEAGENARHLVLYLGDSLNLALVFLVFGVVLLALRRRWGWFWTAFVVTWCAPAAALYVLHHLPKAGYALTLLPGLFLAAGLAFHGALRTTEGRWRRVLGGAALGWFGLVVALNAAAFVLAVPAEALDEDDGVAAGAPVVITGDYGWRGIRWRTEPQRRTRQLVEELGGDDTLVLSLWGTHELQRIDSVYHPEQWTVTSALDHGCLRDSRGGGDDGGCETFGDLQVRILYPPPGGLTYRATTRVSLEGSRLRLRRAGREVAIDLGERPARLLVLAPCPPCEVELGAGLTEQRRLRVSARHRMIVAGVPTGVGPPGARGGPP